MRRTRAVVCGRTKLKEQDLILTLVDEDGCQVRCVAKGARKPGSRLAARTEVASTVDLLLSEGRGLAIISEAQLVDAHTAVRGEVERLALASAVCELARVCSFEESPDPFVYKILNRTLTAAGQAQDHAHRDAVYAAFALKVLSHQGWRPVLDACVMCGEPTNTRLSVEAGGVICESCAKDVPGARLAGEPLVAWLRYAIGCTFDELVGADVHYDMAAALADIGRRWATHHLDCRLRASEFYLGV